MSEFTKLILWLIGALWSAYMGDSTLRYFRMEASTKKRFIWACCFWGWTGLFIKSVIRILEILRG